MKLSLKINILVLLAAYSAYGPLHGTAPESVEPTLISALGQESYKMRLIEPFSLDKAAIFRDTLMREENLRFKYQLALSTGMAVACGYAAWKAGNGIYNWWKGGTEASEEDKKKYLPEQIDILRERLEGFKKRLEIVEALGRKPADLSKLTWVEYFKLKGVNFFYGTARLVPSVGYNLASAILFVQGQNIARHILPRIGDYLFEGRTIAWCIEKKTKLRQAIRDLANWADELVGNPGNEMIEINCLSTSMNIFVEEMEKIVGYMQHVTEQLLKDQFREQERATVSMEIIEKLIGDLVTRSNSFIAGKEKLNESTRSDFALLIKTSFNTIINQMEKFETVAGSCGL